VYLYAFVLSFHWRRYGQYGVCVLICCTCAGGPVTVTVLLALLAAGPCIDGHQ
jgi:hypothetical protein